MDIRVPLKASRKPRQHIIAMVKNMVGGGDEVDGDTPLMESDGPRSSLVLSLVLRPQHLQ